MMGRHGYHQMKSLGRKPDLILALIFAEMVVPAVIRDTAEPGLAGIVPPAYNPLQYSPLLIALLYMAFESIRYANPLAGAAVGAFGLSMSYLCMCVRSAYSGRFDAVTMLSVLFFAAIGAMLGLATGSLAWLVRRLFRRRERQSTEPDAMAWTSPRPTGLLLAVIMLLALAPLAESVGWAVQAGIGFREQLAIVLFESRVPNAEEVFRTWWMLLSLERFVVVVLASAAAYALLRRRPLARGLLVVYMVVGLLFALARIPVFRFLQMQYAYWGLAPTSGYMLANMYMPRPPVAANVLYGLTYLEVPIRALACAIGLPYVLMSRKLGEFLRSVRPEP
jgi:hypothetical protein